MQRRERGIAEAHLLHRAGLEVLGEHVEVRHEPPQQRRARGQLQVDPDAALAEVVAQIGRANLPAVAVDDLWPRAAPRLAVHRVLDLHHVGAQVREQLRGERQCLHLLDREHAHPVEGPRGAALGMAHLVQLHMDPLG